MRNREWLLCETSKTCFCLKMAKYSHNKEILFLSIDSLDKTMSSHTIQPRFPIIVDQSNSNKSLVDGGNGYVKVSVKHPPKIT
jgi:hypothetical protein